MTHHSAWLWAPQETYNRGRRRRTSQSGRRVKCWAKQEEPLIKSSDLMKTHSLSGEQHGENYSHDSVTSTLSLPWCVGIMGIMIQDEIWDQEGWLMPAIPALWEAEVGRSLEVRSSRLAWPTCWKLVATKNIKISQKWWCTPVIPATWEAEAAVSRGRAIVLQPG